MRKLIVTGTDTGVGKTVVAAMLVLALDGYYWKPIQSGISGPTDRETVAVMTGFGRDRLLPERYALWNPISPHRAAELDGVQIDPDTLHPPAVPPNRHLVIEGAGGVLVPVNRTILQIELFAGWQAPVIVVARTTLGTINHTLLTIDALKRRSLPIFGIIFSGDEVADTEATIAEFSGTKILGRVPVLPRLNADALKLAFSTGFHKSDFE